MAQNWNNQNPAAANYGNITYTPATPPGSAPTTPQGNSGTTPAAQNANGWPFGHLSQQNSGQTSGLGGFINGLSQIGGMFHGGQGGQPAQPQIPAEWQTWFQARPQRPDGGFGDPAARDAYRTSIHDWWGTHPAFPEGFGMGMGLQHGMGRGLGRHGSGGGLFNALMHRFES